MQHSLVIGGLSIYPRVLGVFSERKIGEGINDIGGQKMDFILCAYGIPEEVRYIPFVKDLVDGFELQNCDKKGVLSEKDWQEMVLQFQQLTPLLPGKLVIHGPFSGIAYNYKDCLLNGAVSKRMDLTYKLAEELKPEKIVLHTGFSDFLQRFCLEDEWLEESVKFWKEEIRRYGQIGVTIVLENIIEQKPDAMIRLAEKINSPFFGLCLDTGHANLCSSLPLESWVEAMGRHLKHVHLHDNNGGYDEHLPVGKGSICFDGFFKALSKTCPNVTVSLEVVDTPEKVMENFKMVKKRYGHN